jgi:hypothetical protein
MITKPRPTRQVVLQTTREVVRRHPCASMPQDRPARPLAVASLPRGAERGVPMCDGVAGTACCCRVAGGVRAAGPWASTSSDDGCGRGISCGTSSGGEARGWRLVARL